MPVGGGEATSRRRRRTPDAARREIIAAAETLLRERPFRELTVDEVMRSTGLSRPSFYVYFRDRHDLVLRLVEHLGEQLRGRADSWLQAPVGGPDLLRAALHGIVDVYEQHAAVLRALADAAVEDPDVERAYEALVQGFVDATARQVQGEIDAGRVDDLDAAEVSKALVAMAERYLYHSFAPASTTPTRTVAETLTKIYVRTIYQAS